MASASSKADRLQRLRDLHLKINEARKANHAQVVEEDRRKKLPSNWEARQARLKYEEEEEQFKAKCKAEGLDAERAKALTTSADLVDRLEQRKRRKKPFGEEPAGFSSYSDASHRKYLKQAKQLKPDLKAYEKQKETLGDLAYPTANTIGLAGNEKDSRDAVERLANYVKEQSEKRAPYSRRRAFDADADIDYINERNKRYNELLERHYGKYTAEIKQNLERGTAL
ncbi:hypothetical protein AAHC03_022532 [Spirometra sp. Aus1]